VYTVSDLSKTEKRSIAEALVRKSMSIGRKPNGDFDSVSITFNSTDPSCEEFAYMVEEECWKVGAYTIARQYASGRNKVKYQLTPGESLKRMDPLAKSLAETMDVRMFIGEDDDPAWSETVSDKVKLTAPFRQKLFEIMDGRGVKWVYFGWPVAGAAKAYGLTVERFRKIFFNSIRMSFSKELLDLCRFYSSALGKADRIHITSDDTDLKFSLKGRPVIVDDAIISKEDVAVGDVGLNIPSGEVFVAPLETTAEGHIAFPIVVIPGFGRVDNLSLTFKGGKVVAYEADSGKEKFKKFLDANTGEKDRIAELGIGCNPGAEFTNGSIIIDEKIYKTLHIAIGNNTGSYHGTNKASSHLDMIKDMSKGKLIVDGEVVMERGIPVRG
jgi:aminopeptidase